MVNPFLKTVFTCGIIASTCSWAHAEEQTGVEFFEKTIRPVLVDHCLSCHSAEAAERGKLKGGLYLDTRAGLLRGGDSGPAVEPGKPGESLLISALKHESFEMPPQGKLSEAVIADFVRWVKMGAPDPRDGTTVPTVGEVDIVASRRTHWSFQPPEKSVVPAVDDEEWPRGDLDRFILARMEANGLHPMPPADKRTLLRRVTFDLTGLPPTPEEIDRFLADESPKAFERVVDRLLSSPHYGERWARHWLDVARYAEDQAHTFGVKRRESAFQYRDWVVRAFNDDLPFDRFVKLQVAGDLMTEESPDRFVRLAGLGFLGLGAEYYKNSDKAQAQADELDDAVDTVTRGFLGLTVSCARCHDHKYDPITAGDYYALAGVFNGRRYATAPLVEEPIVRVYAEAEKHVREQEESIREWLRQIARDRGEAEFGNIAHYIQLAWRINTLKEQGVQIKDEDAAEQEQLHPYFVRRFREFLEPRNRERTLERFPELKPCFGDKSNETKDSEGENIPVPEDVVRSARQLQQKAEAALARHRAIEREYAAATTRAKDEQERKKIKKGKLDGDTEKVLKNLWLDGRGPLFAREKEAERDFLVEKQREQLGEMRAELDSRRAAMPPKYPVAHVIRDGGRAMQIFIRGNPANRGDWVARGFPEVLSDQPRPTEPQAAQSHSYTRLDLAEDLASPENPLTARVIVNRLWQWHFGRGLVASASNFGRAGTPPTHPELLDWLTVRFIENGWSLKWLHREIVTSATYRLSSDHSAQNSEVDAENRFLWRFPRRRLEVEAWRDALLAVSGNLDRSIGGPTLDLSDRNNHRRTLYAKISRHELSGLLRLFDFPDANVSSAARTETTVPQQQLFVLNSDFFIDQARSFASRVQAAGETDADRIRVAYRLAYSREATAREIALGEAFLSSPELPDDRLSRWAQYCQALFAANEFLYID